MKARRALIALLAIWSNAGTSLAASPGYFDLNKTVTLETGESWSGQSGRYHLYGVQACLRGTSFTNRAGEKLDCGDASMAVFAAFIKDTHPQCAPVARVGDLTYVVCFASVGKDQLDLATVMISKGYAFAALDANGLPINPAYAVAEEEAKQRKAGLWQFPDVQHPAVLLSHAANTKWARQQ